MLRGPRRAQRARGAWPRAAPARPRWTRRARRPGASSVAHACRRGKRSGARRCRRRPSAARRGRSSSCARCSSQAARRWAAGTRRRRWCSSGSQPRRGSPRRSTRWACCCCARVQPEAGHASLAPAAAQGFLPASYELAVLARDAGDLAAALALLRPAAAQGLPEPECELGVFFSMGCQPASLPWACGPASRTRSARWSLSCASPLPCAAARQAYQPSARPSKQPHKQQRCAARGSGQRAVACGRSALQLQATWSPLWTGRAAEEQHSNSKGAGTGGEGSRHKRAGATACSLRAPLALLALQLSASRVVGEDDSSPTSSTQPRAAGGM